MSNPTKHHTTNLPFDGTILDVLLLKASGIDVSFGYNLEGVKVKDQKLSALINNYLKISSDTTVSNYYKTTVLPLYYPVKMSTPVTAYHAKTVTAVFDTFNLNYLPSNDEINLCFTPKNEIELLNVIGWTYGSDVSGLKYMDKVRVLETWSLHLTSAAKNSIILTAEARLSISDLLVLLNRLPSATVLLQSISARHGYVDIGKAPLTSIDMLEQAFDD